MQSKRSRPLGLAALIPLALLALGCTEDEPAAPNVESAAVPRAVFSQAAATNQHVIVMADDIPADLPAAVVAVGGQVLRMHPEVGVLTTAGLSDGAASELGARADIEEINRDVQVQWVPPAEELMGQQLQAPPSGETDQSSAFFFNFWQWNMRQIEADDAWLTTAQGAGALVCVLDTGVDPGHLDLVGKVDLAKSASFVASEPFIQDLNFHGTFVSALISSRGIGMASVAPDATLCAIKVLNSSGSGTFGDVIAGIMHSVSVGADAINMSLGAHIPDDPAFKGLVQALTRSIKFARDNGVVPVASAGNLALNLDVVPVLHIPSQIKHVVSVGATAPIAQTNFDQLASYTNFGVAGVDVMAPGGDLVAGGAINDLILSACSQFVCGATNIYVLSAGTSFAAPHVAGAAAVVESNMPGDQDFKKIERCITKKGTDDLGAPGRDPFYGRGRENVARAAVC